MTATNSLPPQSRNGNIVAIAAELVGPFGTWSTWWTFHVESGVDRPIARLPSVYSAGSKDCRGTARRINIARAFFSLVVCDQQTSVADLDGGEPAPTPHHLG